MALFLRGADFGVAVFRATNSGCSEPHSASEMRTFSLSPLPDRNGSGLLIGTERYISMGNADLSPLISRLRDSFPPRGSQFARFLSHYMTRQQGRIVKANHNSKIYLTYLPCTPRSLCSHSVRKASPWGKLSRKRLMRGDKSALTKAIHSPYAPHSANEREAALFIAPHLPINPKTSLHGNRRPKNAENPHNPKRRLPCREVRGGSGRFGG